MKFGICCSPQQFATRDGETVAGLERLVEVLAAAGADYVEFPVAVVQAEGDVQGFEALRGALETHGLRAQAFNSFIPGHQRIVGEVDLNAVLAFCQVALSRCKALGAEVIVLGSGSARRVPEGFDAQRARSQFIEFCRELAPIADDVQVDIAIEPLNKREDNFCNSVQDGAALMDEITHPRIRLLADLYHMSEENEPMQNVADAGARLAHTHVADRARVAPGTAAEEEDFVGFFRALRAADYRARCSFEGSFDNVETQIAPMIQFLQRRWRESA